MAPLGAVKATGDGGRFRRSDYVRAGGKWLAAALACAALLILASLILPVHERVGATLLFFFSVIAMMMAAGGTLLLTYAVRAPMNPPAFADPSRPATIDVNALALCRNQTVRLQFEDGEEVEAMLLDIDTRSCRDLTYEVRKILHRVPSARGSEVGRVLVAPLHELIDWSPLNGTAAV